MSTDFRNKGAIRDKAGSNSIIVYEVDDTTFAMASTFASFNIGEISKIDMKQASSNTQYPNEGGKISMTEYSEEITVSGILMQCDKALIDFLGTDVKTKTYGMLRTNLDIDGKKQEWFFGGGKITPQWQVSSPGGVTSMPFEYTALDNSSAVTLSTTALTSIGAYTTSAVTIAVNTVFEIVETA